MGEPRTSFNNSLVSFGVKAAGSFGTAPILLIQFFSAGNGFVSDTATYEGLLSQEDVKSSTDTLYSEKA